MKIKGEKLTIKEFFRRWKEGTQNLPAKEIFKLKLISGVGLSFSYVFALIMLLIVGRQFWYLLFIFMFAGVTQVLATIEQYQQYMTLKKLESGDYEQVDEEEIKE